MANNVYVWSGASGTGSGTSWANAFLTLATAFAGSAAGDVFFVAQDHAETQAAALSLTCPGTAAAPSTIYCVNRAGSVPPVAADLATTATVSTTGASTLNLSAGYFGYIYGITFLAGSAANSASITLQAPLIRTENVGFVVNNTNTSPSINWGLSTANTPCRLVFGNGTTFKFGNVLNSIHVQSCKATWSGVNSGIAGTIIPTTLFSGAISYGAVVVVDGVDLTPFATGKVLVSANIASPTNFFFFNVKLAAGLTLAGTPSVPGGMTADFVGADSSPTTDQAARFRYEGTLTIENTVVLSGGATNGEVAFSWKIITTANAKQILPFEAFPIYRWVETGAAVTINVEMLNDGVTLTNAEAWIDVEYLGSSATPQGFAASSGLANPLSVPVAVPGSSAVWNTTGIATPIPQKMSATFTPLIAGYVKVTPKLARPTKTFYIDAAANP